MATPVIQTDTDQIIQFVIDDNSLTTIQPSKTYAMNHLDDRIIGTCDGMQAALQWIYKCLNTYLNETEIYGSVNGVDGYPDYGSEIQDLINKDIDYAKGLVRDLVEEALARDDRFIGIETFDIMNGEQEGSLHIITNVIVVTGTNRLQTETVTVNYPLSA